MKLIDAIPDDWKELLKTELESEWFGELQSFLDEEWQNETVYPPAGKIFDAAKCECYSTLRTKVRRKFDIKRWPYFSQRLIGIGQIDQNRFSLPHIR